MGRGSKGVRTIPGVLTFHLDQLDLKRKDLASLVGVSVRTIHHIETGTKLVSPEILSRVAIVLTERWCAMYPRSEVPFLAADIFSADPNAIGSTFLAALALNQPELVVSDEHSLVSTEGLWSMPGDEDVLPFAGTRSLKDIKAIFGATSATFSSLLFSEHSVLTDSHQSMLIVRANPVVVHPLSGESYSFRAYMELELHGSQVKQVQGVYDDSALTEFCLSGSAPRPKKSQP